MAVWRRHLGATGVIVGAIGLSRLTRYEIAERSMEPTLSPGDWVIGASHPTQIDRGDVVVFSPPTGPDLVKRVTAVAGERVPALPGDVLLQPGELWVTGDNPAAGSVDSAAFGPISVGSVKARLVLRYRPLPLKRIR